MNYSPNGYDDDDYPASGEARINIDQDSSDDEFDYDDAASEELRLRWTHDQYLAIANNYERHMEKFWLR
jgi:hypothetical protein